MREDLLKVLTMISKGNLEVEKGADLIDAMYKKEDKALDNINYDRRMFRILVDSADRDNVKVNLPVVAITSILKATGKLPIKAEEMEGIDLEMMTQSIISSLDNEMLGEIVTVDSANGDKVRILIE